ncbi:hypothetical protein C8F01DRAFT_751599 [Mycena amicta]|nr:hypothetical protein C8F01DRAFT_751599 [Mycena amicta]
MDSNITHVPGSKPSTILTFTPNSMVAATISRSSFRAPASAVPLYRISTGSTDSTTIKDAESGRVVAKISRKVLLPDTVSFADEPGLGLGGDESSKKLTMKEVKVTKWMREVKLPGGGSGHLLETAYGVKYILRRHVEHRLALFPDSSLNSESTSTSETPIAYWRLPDPSSPHKGVSLVLDGAPEDFPLQILVAFIIAEHKMRREEKWSLVAEARVTTGIPSGYGTHGTGQYME